jgi:hypothetical protein
VIRSVHEIEDTTGESATAGYTVRDWRRPLHECIMEPGKT